MGNTRKFYEVIRKIQENKFPIRLSRHNWKDVESILIPYLVETGDFDNVHLCWVAALASLVKKIIDKQKHNAYTIKLTATEYYAVKEVLSSTLIEPSSVSPGLLLFAAQIKKAQSP